MNEKFINYQGNKSGLIEFIHSGIAEYIDEGETVLDIFSGSGAVSSGLKEYYSIYSNDAEPFSFAITDALLNKPNFSISDLKKIEKDITLTKKQLINSENLFESIQSERKFIEELNTTSILMLYSQYPTVWNSSLYSPTSLRKKQKNNLFTRYYASSYFGIEQAVEIDAIIEVIKQYENQSFKNFLYACLFFAMDKTVFSRDGHMAQPLTFEKNPKKGFEQRSKSLFENFLYKLKNSSVSNSTSNHKSFCRNFENILSDNQIMKDVNLIYADPPYTDMQYSRYYHLLNVAYNYNYPELTTTKNGLTTGLYTEGRFQSALSQKGNAKKGLIDLISASNKAKIPLAISYAYPKDKLKQATNRYTISINDLIDIAKGIYGPDKVNVKQIEYKHSNHRNKTQKPVIEYLVLCGVNKRPKKKINISNTVNELKVLKPTNRSPIYNTNLYWSQKSHNIIDKLITELSEPNDIIFDPFMGSGVTILEAVKKKNNRNAIGVDLNEMPNFIVKSILKYSFQDKLENDLKHFMTKIKTLNHYYKHTCKDCGDTCIIESIHFDKPKRTSNDIQINAVNVVCPSCGKYTIESQLQRFSEDMFYEYSYKNIDKSFYYLVNSKIAVGEENSILDIFTNRNLKVLDEIIELSKSLSNDSFLIIRYILMSFMHQAKITDKRSNSQWPLWIPKKGCVERNVISLFNKKTNLFIKALKDIKETYHADTIVNSFDELKSGNALLLQKPSQLISKEEIPNDSVDLIITDPPYLDQVLYSEYMQLYAPILNFDFNLEDEIVVSPGKGREKNLEDYYSLLKDVISLCAAKLKKNKPLCLYFHDSNLSVWNKLITILNDSGFVYTGQVHIKKNNTLKNIISPRKSLTGDLIMFFNNSKISLQNNSSSESIEEIEANIIKEAKFLISNHGPMSTTELYDNGIMEILILNGWLSTISVKYKTLVDIFEKYLYWDAESAKWNSNLK